MADKQAIGIMAKRGVTGLNRDCDWEVAVIAGLEQELDVRIVGSVRKGFVVYRSELTLLMAKWVMNTGTQTDKLEASTFHGVGCEPVEVKLGLCVKKCWYFSSFSLDFCNRYTT